jgi:hypothetical protein
MGKEIAMTALVKSISCLSSAKLEAEILKVLALFYGGCLLALILQATYGLDLSPGFFSRD